MAWLANPKLFFRFGRVTVPTAGLSVTLAVALSVALSVTLAAGPALAQTPDSAGSERPARSGPTSLLPDAVDTPAPGAFVAPMRLPAQPAADTQSNTQGDTANSEDITNPFGEDLAPSDTARQPPADPLALLAGPTGTADSVGMLTPASGGYAADLFATSDARFLAALLGRIDGPLASRWMQISLQRALLSQTTAPSGLNPADWVAARGATLAAMGSAADAHRLVSAMAINFYTDRLYRVAADAALASADPIALCPLSPTARAATGQPEWTLLDAMCLSVLGDDISATALFDQLRRQGKIDRFDIGLAERVGSAIGGGRRGANPAWAEIDGLNVWRIGLTAATGLALPEPLLATATATQRSWIVRLAGAPLTSRAQFAADAAAIGAISSAEANRLLADASAALTDRKAAVASPGGQIRTANTATNRSERIDALKALWARARPDTPAHYGWQVITAPAAARITPDAALAKDAPTIAQSLAAAGIDAPLGRWWRALRDEDAASRAGLWAASVALVPDMAVDSGLFGRWANSVSPHRSALLAAGLDGLGRGRLGDATPALDNVWTQALDSAVSGRRTGEAVVLAAAVLRGGWAEVPPDYLRRIAKAFTALGLGAEARLIVAEAATRG